MKVLLTGSTGYIAQRLLPVLLERDYEVVCCVRDSKRFNYHKYPQEKITLLEVDFLKKDSLNLIPKDIDVAYYLIHSMSSSTGDFSDMESLSARNFREAIENTQAKQVIYLSGIVNDTELSKHLRSRKNVEDILQKGKFALTTLRAGIIIGSGSASFEIMRDLVEKMPILITPKWVLTRSQFIAIRNVIQYLGGVIMRTETFNKSYDIAGPEILCYKEMLLRFAKVRGLNRRIIVMPFVQLKLSAFWLYFVTSVTYSLAKNLVFSMKTEVVGKANNLREMLGIELINYETAIELAFDKIEQNDVLSSWKDAQTSKKIYNGIVNYIEVPTNGCYKDVRILKAANSEVAFKKIWTIGGDNGWYYANWLWDTRGFIDRLFGGVGIRRGRKSPTEIFAGDALDFWRVLLANKDEKRLLLFGEMKVPGEAWLEFIVKQDGSIQQTATFRPLGILGRLYWFFLMPIHCGVFKGMIRKIAE
ncbi:MAG: SDR family oxidoreductase [Bacteroidales bacterium]